MQIFQIRGQAQKGKAVDHNASDQFEHRGLLRVWRAPLSSENGMDAMLEAGRDSWCRRLRIQRIKALIFDAIEQKKPDHATYQSAVVADALQVRSNAKLDLLRHLLSRPLPDPRSNVVARLLAVFVHQRRCHCHAPIVQPLAQFIPR